MGGCSEGHLRGSVVGINFVFSWIIGYHEKGKINFWFSCKKEIYFQLAL